MYRYLIVSNTLHDDKVQEVAHDWYKLREGVWAIASVQATCFDVANQLGMTDARENDGVILKVDEIYGLYNPALWDKISAWGKL